MKRINIILIIILSFIGVFLIIELSLRGSFNKFDDILLIILLALGVFNSINVRYRKWKEKNQPVTKENADQNYNK